MPVDVDEGIAFTAVDEMVVEDLVVESPGSRSSDGHDNRYSRMNTLEWRKWQGAVPVTIYMEIQPTCSIETRRDATGYASTNEISAIADAPADPTSNYPTQNSFRLRLRMQKWTVHSYQLSQRPPF